MKFIRPLFVSLLLTVAACASAFAMPYIFYGTIKVHKADGTTQAKTVGYNTMSEIIDDIDGGAFDNLFKGFDRVHDTASADLDIRGLSFTVDYHYEGSSASDVAGSNVVDPYRMVLIIPGVTPPGGEPFKADSYAALQQDVKEWVQDNPGTMDAIASAMVSQTPFDPVGGNPSSLMAQMVDHAFDMGDNVYPNSFQGKSRGFFNIIPSYENYSVRNDTVQMLSLPIEYGRYFNGGKTALLFDMPIYLTLTDGSKTYSAALGVGLQHYFNQHWALIPSFYSGATGSIDLAAGSLVFGGNIKSRLRFEPKPTWQVGVSNMLGYIWTQPVKIGSMKSPYVLQNWATKNGVDISKQLRRSPYFVRAFYNNTYIFGHSAWYINTYNTVGINLTRRLTRDNLAFNRWSIGVSYLFGAKNYQGFNVNASFGF